MLVGHVYGVHFILMSIMTFKNLADTLMSHVSFRCLLEILGAYRFSFLKREKKKKTPMPLLSKHTCEKMKVFCFKEVYKSRQVVSKMKPKQWGFRIYIQQFLAVEVINYLNSAATWWILARSKTTDTWLWVLTVHVQLARLCSRPLLSLQRGSFCSLPQQKPNPRQIRLRSELRRFGR